MQDVVITGVGMTPFARHPDRTLRSLAQEATRAALADAAVPASEVGMVFFANAVGGLMTGQEMIRGQAALRHTGLLGAPIVNVENACASSATAAHLAWLAVASGQAEIAIAVGAEKLSHPDKTRALDAIGTAIDLEYRAELAARLAGSATSTAPTGSGSLFMDIYAHLAREFLDRTGAEPTDLARVAVKNRGHAALNPRAQHREPMSVAQVLDSRLVSWPLTLPMCSPIGDGAAAVVFSSAERAAAADGVRVLASALVSGTDEPTESASRRAAAKAYDQAGLGPDDLDVAEVHDAAAPAELLLYEELGLCRPGDAAGLIRAEATTLGGKLPVNTSGGLLSKGHPLGATGCAQLVELVEQLRGHAGARQVPGARVGLAENGGGFLGTEPAAVAVHILAR